MDDRQIVTYLVVVAIVLIVVIEGMTVLGLVDGFFGGGGGNGTDTPTDPGTAVDRVGVGEDLLAETDQSETLTSATLVGEDPETLTLAVNVSNTGDRPYELRLGDVTTRDGQRVAGNATSGPIEPGGTELVTAQWVLPGESSPDTVAVTALVRTENGTQVLVERAVPLERFQQE